VRDEFRILKESISVRVPLANHVTLLFVDGGSVPTDSAWLWAFAASILNDDSKQTPATIRSLPGSESSNLATTKPTPKVLIVEAAGAESGLADALGIDANAGLSDVIQGTFELQAAIQET